MLVKSTMRTSSLFFSVVLIYSDLFGSLDSGFPKMNVDLGNTHSDQRIQGLLSTSPENCFISQDKLIPLLHAAVVPSISVVDCRQPVGVQLLDVGQDSSFSDLMPASSRQLQHVKLESAVKGKEPGDAEDNVMDVLSQLCETIDGDMFINHAQLASFDSILPPMSPEDVESFLSSDSPPSIDVHVVPSPVPVESSNPMIWIDSEPNSPASISKSGWSSPSFPGSPLVEKKRRKKEQNKTAALRYRQKKRSEQGVVFNECEELERRNIELKSKVSEMTREVNYLKGLIDEICA